ncbi:MAG: YtxH domain-containing protein [Bacteroidota bacterium]|nr:YtxH domain-containing protein [Bacteroidota bacterium]
MNSGKVLLGVLAGLAAGALMGILLAPDKGSQTRRKILGKGEDFADALKDKFDELADTLTNKFENTQQEAEELISYGKAKYDGAKKA